MTSLPHGTLPLATTPAFTPRACAPVREASAWTQALARATASAAPAVPQQASGPHALVAAMPPLPDAASPACADDGRAAGAGAPRPEAASRQPASALALPPLARDPGSGVVDAPALPSKSPQAEVAPDLPANEPGDDARRSPRARPLLHEQAGPRVHVELHDDGLAVWLGLDAGPQAAACATGVLEELRRHAGGLPRLALLVCNGTPIPTRPLPSKETP